MKVKELLRRLTIKQKQWLWFFALWFAGLITVSAIGYAIKLLMFAQL